MTCLRTQRSAKKAPCWEQSLTSCRLETSSIMSGEPAFCITSARLHDVPVGPLDSMPDTTLARPHCSSAHDISYWALRVSQSMLSDSYRACTPSSAERLAQEDRHSRSYRAPALPTSSIPNLEPQRTSADPQPCPRCPPGRTSIAVSLRGFMTLLEAVS
ncbi:hypothetical protein C8Q73DRAFT_145261 [Cubamyces lactineus]|nr:hypothetical protein C8Q73DRAFT_145261 [Cubamyces lactineus]